MIEVALFEVAPFEVALFEVALFERQSGKHDGCLRWTRNVSLESVGEELFACKVGRFTKSV